MVIGLEKLFPGLVGKNYQVTSPANDVYNCIAWAANRVSEWWWPYDAPGHDWPAGVAKTESMPAFHETFATLGYAICSDAALDSGFEKVAIFADDNGIPTHAARQLTNGRWTSKLGKLEDIEHDLLDLIGIEYGTVVSFMRRPQTKQEAGTLWFSAYRGKSKRSASIYASVERKWTLTPLIFLEVSPIFEAAVQRAIESSKRPLPEEMSIGQAAEFLDVSREYIITRIKRGELPCRLVGKRRRIPSAALVEENEKMFQRARKAAAEMTRISQELGLYDSDPSPAQTQ